MEKKETIPIFFKSMIAMVKSAGVVARLSKKPAWPDGGRVAAFIAKSNLKTIDKNVKKRYTYALIIAPNGRFAEDK